MYRSMVGYRSQRCNWLLKNRIIEVLGARHSLTPFLATLGALFRNGPPIPPSARPLSLTPFLRSCLSDVPAARWEWNELSVRHERGMDGVSDRRAVHRSLRSLLPSLSPVPFVPSSFGPSRPRSFLTSVARFLTSSGTTGRSEGGKEPRTTVRPLRVSLSRSVRTSLTSPSETRSAHFARSCLRREW